MKRLILFITFMILIFSLFGVGIILNSASTSSIQLAQLQKSSYNVSIENQVAVVKSQEVFKNNFSVNVMPRLYFPIPSGASATKIRWYALGTWFEANISPNPQNPPGGPSTLPSNITEYLTGKVPLVFDVSTIIAPNDTLLIELTYVQLLPYSSGNVDIKLQNDYSLIQTAPLLSQTLDINLSSERNILAYDLLGINSETNNITLHNASTHYQILNASASTNYQLRFTLNQEELGIWTMSNYFETVPDSSLQGFFTMIVEPDPSENTQVIDKVFTLVVDKSGSMSGDKITQAKEAATYIVNNLNEGDKFNIITFSTAVQSLWTTHQDFNTSNRQTALNFINTITAQGSTNISGAFDTAVPQFAVADSNTANIIIFMTDGEQTAGITDTQELITHIDNLIAQTETNINLFNFGIGSSVNQQLLSTVANNNNGFATYLGNNDLYEVLTEFYNFIRNPVLLNPIVTFQPENVISDIHPLNLANLYKGQQMIISGRYSEPVNIAINFTGLAYGQPVSYNYNIVLSDSNQTKYSFLTKIWAKQKIEDLLAQYYTYPNMSPEAEAIRQQIVNLSITWNIITPFTSFVGGTFIEEETENTPIENAFPIKLLGNYPNPFNPNTEIRFSVKANLSETAYVKIYNLKGQLIKILKVKLNGKGEYSVLWNGKNELGHNVATGIYLYKINCDRYSVTGKMTLIK